MILSLWFLLTLGACELKVVVEYPLSLIHI